VGAKRRLGKPELETAREPSSCEAGCENGARTMSRHPDSTQGADSHDRPKDFAVAGGDPSTSAADVVREAAARAAALGYHLVALHGVRDDGACTCAKRESCPSPGKHPRGRKWHNDAGTPELFRRYTDGQAIFNLGLRLNGDASVPLILLDIDTKHDKPGAASFADLEADYGSLPDDALLQMTPSGGQHYLLRLPEGVDPHALPNRADVLPGVDVFTHQRQFVLTPSRTALGAYAFATGRGLVAPSDLPVLPASWIEGLQAHGAARAGVSRANADADPAPDPQLVVQLLEVLPAPAVNTRDEAVAFGMAVHGALANADSAVDATAEPAFLRWASRWPGAAAEQDQHIWETTGESKHRGWRQFLGDAQLFINRAHATTPEDAGITDGADVAAAQALLERIRAEEAQADFDALPGATPPLHACPSLLVRSFADVTPKRIDWLLLGRVARQQITMVNGWPGEGKTSVVIDIAARMTRAEPLPDNSLPPRPLRILFLSTEDSESILHLRLRAAGADMDRVFTIPDTKLERLTLPSHKTTWVQVLQAYEIDVVVVDPMKAFLDNSLKDIAEQDARRFMLALRQVCEETNVAAICIRHPNKGTAAGHSTAVSSASGSLGFTAAARIELLVGRMPEDEETRALVHVKNNLAKPPVALLYRIVSKDVSFDGGTATQDVAGIEWKGTDDKVLADELLAKRHGREERSRLEEAKEFLKQFLASGPAEHTTVRRAAKPHGIAERTLERARVQLGWTAIVGNLRAGGKSIWGLEGQSPADFAAAAGEPLEESGLEPADVSDLEVTQSAQQPIGPTSGKVKPISRKPRRRKKQSLRQVAK